MWNQERSRIAAFNLIELMIVISIIGLLVNVAIPEYHRFVAKSQHVDKGIKEGFAGRLKMNIMLIEVGRRFRPVPFKEDALERIAIAHAMRINDCIYNVNTSSQKGSRRLDSWIFRG